MIATRAKFKREGNGYVETSANHKIGLKFTLNGISYRMICENPIIDFDIQIFKFPYSLWFLEPISNVWTWVKNSDIVADTNVWKDSEGNKYINSGNNTDSNNAFDYDDEGLSTLKDGLNTEYDMFYNGIFLGIIEPQISASIIEQEMNSITSIV